MKRAFGALAIVTTLGLTQTAMAQETNDAQAQRLFDEGRALMEQGRIAEACPKLLASERLASSGGTILNLADCYEKEGKLASAWARFREAAARAAAAGRADIETHANDRAKALAPKLSTLTVTVPPASEVNGLVLMRDGTVIERGAWGTALPIDPGSYLIEATAPGRAGWSARVEVKANADRASIAVGPLLEERAPIAEPKPLPKEVGWPTTKTVGLALGVAGVVGVGIGSFFGLRASSLNDDALGHCPASPRCNDPEGPKLTQDAETAATISTISFIAGAALLVGGAVLFFTAPSSRTTAKISSWGTF